MAAPVLVIDDDAAIAGILADTLDGDGYVVEAVTSRQEAVTRVTASGPEGYCLVMSDSFSRPPEAPFVWLDEVRTLTTAPVVIASAHPATVFPRWAERGCAAFLPKPIELDELTPLVVALCGWPEQDS
jgi:DNA-binding NtrC family response regulator